MHCIQRIVGSVSGPRLASHWAGSTCLFSNPCSEPPPSCARSCQASNQKRTEPVGATRASGIFFQSQSEMRYSTRLR
jgi:hypothetical protein